VAALKKENNQYKKHIADTEDKMNALKGRLSYLNIEAQSLQTDIKFIKSNPGSWPIPETEDYLRQLQSGIAEANNESELFQPASVTSILTNQSSVEKNK
jgi:hypothetical protein